MVLKVSQEVTKSHFGQLLVDLDYNGMYSERAQSHVCKGYHTNVILLDGFVNCCDGFLVGGGEGILPLVVVKS